MQARPRIYQLVLVLIVASMLLGACGGSGAGSTWFNLPSVPVKVQADGTAKVFGFSLPAAILTADQISQLQASNIQQLNIRVGHNGAHFYANGEDLPYIAWNDDSFATLQEILPKLSAPLGINGGQIASILPWARRIGLGAAINLPVGSGQSVLDIPRWSGETSFTPETPPAEPTLGPFNLAGLAVNPDDGTISIDGMPLSRLEQAFGVSFGASVPADVLNILAAIDAETFSIATNPNGIDLALNGKPLPSIAYDSASLDQVLVLIDPLVTDANLAAQLNDLVPKLPGAQVSVLASLTGEPAGKTALQNVKLTLDEQGVLGAYGFPIVGLLPAAVMPQLMAANLQQIDAKIEDDTILLAANGKTIPSIAWNNDTLPVLSQLVGGVSGLQPTFLSTLIDLLKDTGVNASINLPVADGAEAIVVGDPFADGIQAPDLGDFAPPTIHVSMAYDSASNLKSIGPVTAQELQEQMGVALPPLPANIVAILDQAGANQLQAINSPGQFDVMINDASAVALKYDVDSLVEVLGLLSPFLEGTIMDDPAISGLIMQEVLPLVPGSDLNVNVLLNQ